MKTDVGVLVVWVNRENPWPKIHLAAVLLKQYVKQHWQKDEKNFVEPEVSPEDKVCSRYVFAVSGVPKTYEYSL